MTPLRIISLDIETYGLFEADWEGNPLPSQNYFDPRKSLLLDGVDPSRLILTCSITLPEFDPRCPQSSSPTEALVCTKKLMPSSKNSGENTGKTSLNCTALHSDAAIATQMAVVTPFNNQQPHVSENGCQTLCPTECLTTITHPNHNHDPANKIIDKDQTLALPLNGVATSQHLKSIAPTWNAASLSQLKPGPSMLAMMWKPAEVAMLRRWIAYADTLIGMNLLFDLQYLRTIPEIRAVLDGRHTLIDLSMLNYQHNEYRPERSLKNIGPLFRLYSYEEEEISLKKGQRYPNPLDPRAHRYNAMDSHNAILAVACLAGKIQLDFGPCIEGETTWPTIPNKSYYWASSSPPSSFSSSNGAASSANGWSHKLSPWSIKWFSDSLWSCMRMAEAGTPMNRSGLEQFERLCLLKCQIASEVAYRRYNLILSGDGSENSKIDFFNKLLDEIDRDHLPSGQSIRAHLLFEITEKKGRAKLSDSNRLLAKHHLPSSHWGHDALRLWDMHASAQKLLTSYTYGLLRWSRTKADKPDRSKAVLLPYRSATWNSSSSASSSSSTSLLSAEPHGSQTVSWRRRTHKQYAERRKAKLLRHGPWKSKKTRAARIKAAKPALKLKKKFYDSAVLSRGGIGTQLNRCVGIAHPRIYLLPSSYKDSQDDTGGGQKQCRLSFKDPGVQTFPELIKQFELSRWPNGFIVYFDLSQAELRVACLLSHEQSLLRLFLADADLHDDRAFQVFSPSIKDHPDFKRVYRQAAKHANFSDLNWASAKTLQRTIMIKSQPHSVLVPYDVCQQIVDARPSTRPQLYDYQCRLVDQAHQLGRIELPGTGISRWFFGGEKQDHSEIVNLPIQGTAATLMRCIQHRIDRRLPSLSHPSPDIFSYANRYDAAYYDCKTPEAVDRLKGYVKEALEEELSEGYWAYMQDLFEITVPIKYDMKVYQ